MSSLSPPAYSAGENMTALFIDIDILDIIEIDEVNSLIHIKQLTAGRTTEDNLYYNENKSVRIGLYN